MFADCVTPERFVFWQVVFGRIKINLRWALLYNVLAIPIAAGAFFPWFHTILPPQYAGLCMALSSISVVASSLMLKCYRRPSVCVNNDKNQHELLQHKDCFSDDSIGTMTNGDEKKSMQNFLSTLTSSFKNKAKKTESTVISRARG